MPSILPNWSYLYLCSRPLVVEERVSKKEGRERREEKREKRMLLWAWRGRRMGEIRGTD
jgi:hypothetical protein